jgi:hypothetical protein
MIETMSPSWLTEVSTRAAQVLYTDGCPPPRCRRSAHHLIGTCSAIQLLVRFRSSSGVTFVCRQLAIEPQPTDQAAFLTIKLRE